MFKKKKKAFTHFGPGYDLNNPHNLIHVGMPDSHRSGMFWGFGTTRSGKTRLLEHIIEQDIMKGNSVIVIDPKGDADLFSKIVQVAQETGREKELMLVNPIFPKYSIVIDPLSNYYLPEELVAHITAGVPVGKEPYFFNVAYEVSLLIVQSLILLAKHEGEKPSFNLETIKNHVHRDALKGLLEKVEYIKTPEASQLVIDLKAVLDNPPDYYSKVASSLRVALTELTTGNLGKIIGKADANPFIKRLEESKPIILIVTLGSMLTTKAAYTAGKVIVSMVQSFVGRRFASDRKITPPLVLHIDEAQSVLYHGIEEMFAKR